jgi:WD40 repeat protein
VSLCVCACLPAYNSRSLCWSDVCALFVSLQFENIMKLEGHHGEVWTLVVSRQGDVVVSAGHDRSIRVWERTEEQVRFSIAHHPSVCSIHVCICAGLHTERDYLRLCAHMGRR